jgi:hypothetical protein
MAHRATQKIFLLIEFHRIAKSEDERHCLLYVIPVKTGIQSSVLVFLAVSEIPLCFLASFGPTSRRPGRAGFQKV